MRDTSQRTCRTPEVKPAGVLDRETRENMCKNKLVSKVGFPTARSEFQGAPNSIPYHSTANPSGFYR